jgi:hypothetical protein
MGMFDEIKDKATDLAGQHQDKIETVSDQAIEKAGDAVDSATGERFAEQVEAVQAQVDERFGQGQ